MRASLSELTDPVETWAAVLTDADRVKWHLDRSGSSYYNWEVEQLVKTVSAQLEEPGDISAYLDHGAGIDGKSIFEGEIKGLLDEDDLFILLRLCQLKFGGTTGPSGKRLSYHHIVVDETQDLSPVTVCVLVGSAAPKAPVTLAGDTASAFHSTAVLAIGKNCSTTKIPAHILPHPR